MGTQYYNLKDPSWQVSRGPGDRLSVSDGRDRLVYIDKGDWKALVENNPSVVQRSGGASVGLVWDVHKPMTSTVFSEVGEMVPSAAIKERMKEDSVVQAGEFNIDAVIEQNRPLREETRERRHRTRGRRHRRRNSMGSMGRSRSGRF